MCIRDRSYTIPYHLLRDNTSNIAVAHTYTRKRGLERTVIQRRAKKGKKGQKEEKRKEKKEKNETKNHRACAQGAGRVPKGQGRCLLARSVLWYVQVMDQQKYDTTRPDGRQDKQQYLLLAPFFFTGWPTPTDLYPPTHLTRVLRWRESLHTEMLVGGR